MRTNARETIGLVLMCAGLASCAITAKAAWVAEVPARPPVVLEEVTPVVPERQRCPIRVVRFETQEAGEWVFAVPNGCSHA